MSMDMILGGYTLTSSGDRNQIPPVIRPSEQDLLKLLDAIRNKTGVLSMKNNSADDVGPYQLSLYSQDNNYMLLLSEYGTDGEHNVRTLHNNNAPSGFINMLGEMYGSSTIVDDFEPIIVAFTAFLSSGNVSVELLS